MNKRIFYTLLASNIGDQFYILFISVILLKLGYSGSFIAGSIALTSLPNIIFGPQLGRAVDLFPKGRLHTILNIGLFFILLLLGLCVYLMKISTSSMIVITLLMIFYNFLYSPLNTLLYHYVIPMLDVSESVAFIKWEKFQSMGIIISALLSFLILKLNLHFILLPIDAVTFLVASLIVEKNLKIEDTERKKEERPSIKFNFKLKKIRSLLDKNHNTRVIITSTLAIFGFIFAVDAQIYNSGILFLNQFKFDITYIPLIMASLSMFNILGATFYERFMGKFNPNNAHTISLAVILLGLCSIFLSLVSKFSLLILLGLVIIQFVEPIWSSTNSVLLRSQIQKDKYGEFFGYFRIIRSIFTSSSIFLFGLAQNNHYLNYYIFIGIIFIGSIITLNFYQIKKAELCLTN